MLSLVNVVLSQRQRFDANQLLDGYPDVFRPDNLEGGRGGMSDDEVAGSTLAAAKTWQRALNAPSASTECHTVIRCAFCPPRWCSEHRF